MVTMIKLGGDCRIRSYTKLNSKGNTRLKVAEGENRNPFCHTSDIKQPLISSQATLKAARLREPFIYDFESYPGETHTLLAAQK